MKVFELKTWAQSAGGRDISLYHSEGALDAKNTHPLVWIGGVHGDEPEGVELAQKTLEWLRGCRESEVAVPWVLIPCYNPDGYALNQRTNANGVDLNRNFPAKSWSLEHKTERYYPGPEPASELETRALVDLIRRSRPRLLVHCHSWHPCIVCAGAPGLTDAKYLAEACGYELKETIGYDTPGSLSQFGWHDSRIPVICIEEQEHIPLSEVWPHFASGVKKIFADASPRGAP